VDGHEFVQPALDAGAAAAIVERTVRLPGSPSFLVVPDAREALALAAHALAGDPTQRLTVVGVTGTNGKTTTTYLVRSILEKAGHETGLLGTVGYQIGRRWIPSRMTTPDATDLAAYFAEMLEEGLEAAVMEVSSHALDQRRVAGIAFDVGAFTNLTPEHQDYHKDMPSYRQAKGRLFAGLPAEARAVLNADDETSHAFAEATAARVLWYGLDHPADVRAEDLATSLDGSRFTLLLPRGRAPVHTALLGKHNVRNCLTAAAIAEALVVPIEAIVAGLEAVTTVRGRLEKVPTDRPFTVLVDYAHTADALENALSAVRALSPRRLILVFGCGGDRDREKRPEMARVAERLADRIIVTSDNPRSEDPQAIADEIFKGFSSPGAAAVELDRRRAIELAIREAADGDAVLIAGKGHETYQESRAGVVPFDDREVAREILEAS
jgi:UDP-N-acetylmuramoyl-L-alanyl-D-glutamate--2,6-diaminopimelate ligase